jgi:DHA2 family multidrug resistance protein-like MFS transporter
MTATGASKAGRREWAGLAVLALPTLLVSLDTFVMLLALPRLSAALGAGSTQQLWIMDVYGFMVAGLLIMMGTLGDRIGRRRLLLIGAAAFGAASLLAAYSTGPGMLIAARALLGVAGATLTPSTLALITNLFHDPRQRAGAIGIWAGCFTAGAIIGPVAGGVMLDHFWWGSVFLLAVPPMVLLLVLGPVLLPEFRDTRAGRLDLPSVALSLAAIAPFVYGLKEIARDGWRPLPVTALLAGLVIGTVFLRRQRALPDPLVDLRLFTGRTFSTTLGAMLAFTLLSGGTMMLVAQYLQLVEGLTPLRAGLALVPGMAAAIVGFQLSPILARRIRPAVLFAGGLAVSVAGLLIVTQSGASSGLHVLVIGFAVVSFGGGPLVSLGTGVVIGSAPPEKAGSAAGLAQTGNEFGYALGIAIIGSIATAVYRHQIGDRAPSGTSAAEALTAGLHTAALISAVLLAAIALLIATTLRRLPPLGKPQPDQPEQPAQPDQAGSDADIAPGKQLTASR